MKKGLLVYGDIGMDVLLRTSAFPEIGEDARVEDLIYSPGGSAANGAVVAARLGVPTTFLGTLGDDPWAPVLEADLRNFGVDTHLLNWVAGSSGTCVAVIEPNAEKRFFSFRGVNATDPPPCPDGRVWSEIGGLHLSGYSFQSGASRSAALRLIDEAKRRGITVSLDPSFLFAQQLVVAPGDLLGSIDILFPNREEAQQIGGFSDPLLAARKIRALGVKTVIIKLDRDGCLLLAEETERFIRLNPIETVIDSTGAGDAFCGGYLAAHLEGFSDVECCEIGSAAAVHTITRLGAHEHAPTRADIVGIMRKNPQTSSLKILEEHWN